VSSVLVVDISTTDSIASLLQQRNANIVVDFEPRRPISEVKSRSVVFLVVFGKNSSRPSPASRSKRGASLAFVQNE